MVENRVTSQVVDVKGERPVARAPNCFPSSFRGKYSAASLLRAYSQVPFAPIYAHGGINVGRYTRRLGEQSFEINVREILRGNYVVTACEVESTKSVGRNFSGLSDEQEALNRMVAVLQELTGR